MRRPVGLWLRGQVKPGERVLLEPIGTIGYYSRARMLDMIGLTSPEVFASYRTPAPLADIAYAACIPNGCACAPTKWRDCRKATRPCSRRIIRKYAIFARGMGILCL